MLFHVISTSCFFSGSFALVTVVDQLVLTFFDVTSVSYFLVKVIKTDVKLTIQLFTSFFCLGNDWFCTIFPSRRWHLEVCCE